MFRPSQATLVLVGGMRHAELLAVAQRTFGGWSEPPDRVPVRTPASSIPADPTPRRIALVHREAAAQSELRIGHLAASRRTPDYPALLMMNAILGGQFTSRVNMKLREEKAYTYGARTSFDWKRGLAPFALSTSVHTASTAAAIADAVAEIEAIRGSRPVTEGELAHAKASLTRGYPAGFETASQVARAVSQLGLYDLPDTYFSDFVPTVSQVTTADVTRVAAEYLDPARLTALVVGDAQVVRESLHTLSLGTPLELPLQM
jgi:predicted Zn-dependent peptidase